MIDHQLPLGTWDEAPYNPREISTKELDNLKHSIFYHTKALRDWDPKLGFRLVDPIIVNEFNQRVVGGHKRIECLRVLGQKWIHRDDVRPVYLESEAEEAALNIALNNPKAQGRFNKPKLRELVTTIDTGEIDICMATGYSQDDFDDLFSNVEPPQAPGDPGPDGPGEPGGPPNQEGAATIYQCPACGVHIKKEKGRFVRAQISQTAAREV